MFLGSSLMTSLSFVSLIFVPAGPVCLAKLAGSAISSLEDFIFCVAAYLFSSWPPLSLVMATRESPLAN